MEIYSFKLQIGEMECIDAQVINLLTSDALLS